MSAAHKLRGCNPCRDDDHDDCCEDKVDRHLMRDAHRKFCVEVSGDYCAEKDDREIYVYGGGTVTLPCPDGLDCPHKISVTAADADTLVTNTGTDAVTNQTPGPTNGTPLGTGTVRVAAGTTATFRFVPAGDECGCGSWAAECCPTAAPAPAT